MDFYELLGVSRDADEQQIRRAYRRLARRLHPDINPGDEAAAYRFRAVSEAFDTLIDPDSRRRYDSCGSTVTAVVETASFGFEGFDFSAPGRHVLGAPTFGDLFADVIRATVSPAAAPAEGADLHLSVSVSLAEAMTGVERPVSVLRRHVCRECGGTGLVAMSEMTCRPCGGTGTIRTARGHMVFAKPCESCEGSGRLRQAACRACGGSGTDTRSETVAVPVPAGVADRDRLRVAGKGHAGTWGGNPGDLYVTVQVEPHPLFRRDGADLHLIVPVAVHEAALGAKIDVPAFGGPARLRVPPGTQTGQRFRLHDRGVPHGRDSRRGDLVVEVRIVLPGLLDERSKELLREFGQRNPDDVRADLWRDAPRDA
ncbi:MAG: J domain-containing protein [Acidobacteriota bacterium]